MSDATVDRLAAGYDIVYAAIPNSETFARIWRKHSLGPDYPAGFEHISFATLSELREVQAALALPAGSTLADLACGMGGPGLWVARASGVQLVGVDISAVALAHARTWAVAVGMSDSARFEQGSFAETGLNSGSVDGVMTIDAFQYAPDKRAAFAEIARVLRPGGRFVLLCFELEPERLAGVPILGDDPIGDYVPLLGAAGFDVVSYAQTPGWLGRMTATYQALVDARPALAGEMGEAACSALLGEITLTLQLRPYRGRVMAVARKR